MKDEPLKNCVKCGKDVRRLISSGAGIIFKGSGFYVNDYKNGGSKDSSPAKSEGSACAACPSEGSCPSAG
jgi:predicted nucleic acid-binding Zn ribbon protein